jgi:CubicO group peptidase (beta-lactamase class C family)
LRLWERGQLDLDDPVARYIAEFGQHGKQAVTIQHLLTHTGGFRLIHIGWPESNWDEIIAAICAGKLERGWTPGKKAGYHPYTSWYILGELVRRIDGRPFLQYVRQDIFEPLGMRDSWVGMPIEQYRAYGDRLALMPDTEKPGLAPHRYSSEQGATDCVPGGNGYGPMCELGRFYEMLLAGGELGGARILQAATVARMTSRVREGMFDETFKHVMDWGLGVIVNSNHYGIDTVPYGYGRYASDLAFGHSGAKSSVAFADPAHGLVAAIFLNGTPGEKIHDARMRPINAAIYEDLALR